MEAFLTKLNETHPHHTSRGINQSTDQRTGTGFLGMAGAPVVEAKRRPMGRAERRRAFMVGRDRVKQQLQLAYNDLLATAGIMERNVSMDE